MRLAKTLLITGGVINALFTLFHLWLGWRIHHWAVLQPPVRALMEMLNGGGTLFILLITLVSLVAVEETLTTVPGRLVLAGSAALYLLRGLAEIILSTSPSPLIVAVCTVTGGLYVAILVLARRVPAASRRVAGVPAEATLET